MALENRVEEIIAVARVASSPQAFLLAGLGAAGSASSPDLINRSQQLIVDGMLVVILCTCGVF